MDEVGIAWDLVEERDDGESLVDGAGKEGDTGAGEDRVSDLYKLAVYAGCMMAA